MFERDFHVLPFVSAHVEAHAYFKGVVHLPHGDACMFHTCGAFVSRAGRAFVSRGACALFNRVAVCEQGCSCKPYKRWRSRLGAIETTYPGWVLQNEFDDTIPYARSAPTLQFVLP